MIGQSGNSGAWVLIAPRAAIFMLRPLIRAHERVRPVQIVEVDTIPPAGALAHRLEDAAGALLVGDRRHAPRTVLPGPFITTSNGRNVPVGWLPLTSLAELDQFTRGAARVLRRDGPLGPLVLLGQWSDRYLHLVDRMTAHLRERDQASAPIVRWTAERITRDDLLRGLRIGPGLAIYFGHGRPNGWAAYHGLRDHHFDGWRGEPLGALLSVTCYTASRWHTGVSFSERLVLRGIAASALGAIAPVEHVDNMRWMVGLGQALRDGVGTLGEALLCAVPHEPRARDVYRIIGDPLAPLVGSRGSAERAARVYAPAPDALTGRR